MPEPSRVLVVDDGPGRSAIVKSLQAAGYKVTSAGTFEQASDILAGEPPDVLVTELRLGAFNGLHLIIRGRAARPSVVAVVHTAYPDPVLETEARRLNADFLVQPVDPSVLQTLIAQRLGSRPERRRSGRIAVPEGVPVTLGDTPASLVDVSDDGFRIELQGDVIPSPLEIQVPALGLSIQAQIVWARRDQPEPGPLLCGARILPADARTMSLWRTVLDTVQPNPGH